ncbi:aldo/keto reductase [Tenacibaculum ovolyticum]|uniref:aldo/keto reductase n=1 Tax=Tenacibaculum ovolyticum TaxID=104270 RepID=UPI0022F3C123|nr:aldo/keto reductase [Tenacibaculum ovolyticum]WBX76170.1 aldo/keto reductase [Tenacibaculum ovolyticum]
MSKLNKIILGTVQFGLAYGINNSLGKPSKEKITEILDLAYNKGIRLLDTAEAYGNSHQVIANYHKNSNNRFRIISKYKKDIPGLPENLKDRVKKHIADFRVNELEAYLFHDFEEFLELANRDDSGIISIKEEKLVKKIGVSIYSNKQIEEVLKYPFIELIQVPFNLLDNHKERSEILLKAKEKGVEVHTRSAFLQGLFFKEVNYLSDYFAPIKPLLLNIKSLCKKDLLCVADLALNYPLSKGYINNVLIGVDSAEQLLSNIESLKKEPIECFKIIDNFSVKDNNILNPSNWIK